MKPTLKIYAQADAYSSPWTVRRRIAVLLWDYVWPIACGWTPKPFNRWRLLVLRLFGTEVHGLPFVHGRARIQHPWNLVLHHRACLGDRADAYCLDRVTLGEGCTIAQEAYLCTGSHDFSQPGIPLMTAPLRVGAHVFVGARAFIMPGVTLGDRCIVGACAVVTRDVAPAVVVVGNPARPTAARVKP